MTIECRGNDSDSAAIDFWLPFVFFEYFVVQILIE